jgi:SH3-like domain-containing protein
LLALVVASSGFFLLVARRRRRNDDEPAKVPKTKSVPAAVPAVAPAAAGADPMIAIVDEDLAPVDDDAPLKESRKATKRAAAATAAAAVASSVRTFGKPPPKGVERAMVGYRRVRISSEPDAVRSVELGRLDRGDEVEILESHEGFLRIRTPDDITGWILRHTVVEPQPAEGAHRDSRSRVRINASASSSPGSSPARPPNRDRMACLVRRGR